MNFLAHLYLSGDNEDVKLGNFIGDYVKGNSYNNFPAQIKKGILLHRKIDSFTDSHPIVKKHKNYFYDKYHKYAGVITDIIYDHYLAHNWHMFSEVAFEEYINNTYSFFHDRIDDMPEEMKIIVPNIIKNNWFHSYLTIEGIESVLIGMSKGTSLPPEYNFAIKVFRKNYEVIKHDFFNYFAYLIEYVEKEMESN